jgi:hypothetical protein
MGACHRTIARMRGRALFAGTMLVLAACQPGNPAADFRTLPNGMLDNIAAVVEEPTVLRIVGGQGFATPFGISCTKLDPSPEGWKGAMAAGAHHVAIYFPGRPHVYGGVLAFCQIHKSATGPTAQGYQLGVPDARIDAAKAGAIVPLAGHVAVNRVEPGVHPPTPVTDDYAWLLWLTDRPEIFGVTFQPSGVEIVPPATHVAEPVRAAPRLVAGATYTVLSAVTLRGAPGTKAPSVGHLGPGDAVIATGEEKSGFWAVTTAGGDAGWVSARSLKAN